MSRLKHFTYGVTGVVFGVSLTLGNLTYAEQEDTQKQQKTLPLEQVQRFTTAISQVKNFYVDPVADKKLFDNAIQGMLTGLDPHSDYLDEEEFSDLTAITKGKFSGLGLEVTMEHDVIKVVTPIDDTPAQRAGVKPGDLIIAIDNTPVKGMDLGTAVKMMRGEKGSAVMLTIIREGANQPLKLKVLRDVIKVESVKSKLYDNAYGYIRISNFQVATAQNLQQAIIKLNQEANGQMRGLVLDLRNNPGGLLDSAIDVSDTFLDSRKLGDQAIIVSTKGRVPGANFKATAEPGDMTNGVPIVVLINEGSASAAEIVAGALQDHNRAVVVGKNSFGKGSVQTVLPLDEKTAVKLTTALYYTPSGRSIQAEGIKPDILIADLDMSNAKAKDDTLSMLKEANLIGRLNNGNAIQEKLKESTNTTDKQLAQSDYQLYEALNLLKGLTILQKLPTAVGQLK